QRFDRLVDFFDEHFKDFFDFDSEPYAVFRANTNLNEFDPRTEGLPNGLSRQFATRTAVLDVPLDDITSSQAEISIPGMKPRKHMEVSRIAQNVAQYGHGIRIMFELGCGKGFLTNYLAMMSGSEGNFIGIDHDQCSLKQAKKTAQDLGLDSRFIHSDAESIHYDEFAGSLEPRAVLGLHTCNYLADRIVQSGANLIVVAPCCYHDMDPEHYFISSHGKTVVENSNIPPDDILGELATAHGLCIGLAGDFSTHVMETEDRLGDAGPDYTNTMLQALTLMKRFWGEPASALLALDRAVYLQEQGYTTEVSTFSEGTLTPGNILITAYR
ncbi:MAG: SAM-dependent methyltransferase, partial [Nanoarchaeota archaeon]|nr:SAM-dependent methyltransferase [Nanoarchaeota archaeon]